MTKYFSCLPRAKVSWRNHGILGFVAAGAAFFMGDLFGGSGEDDNEVDPDSSAGTISDDELTGDNSNNLLNGEAGDDILDGAGGEDALRGGEDDDILDGGSGNDELSGGDNSDFLLGFCRAAGAELCQRGNRRRSELGALGLGQHASRQTGADRRRRAPEAVAKLAGFHAQCIISASPSTSNAAFISGSYPGSIRAGP